MKELRAMEATPDSLRLAIEIATGRWGSAGKVTPDAIVKHFPQLVSGSTGDDTTGDSELAAKSLSVSEVVALLTEGDP